LALDVDHNGRAVTRDQQVVVGVDRSRAVGRSPGSASSPCDLIMKALMACHGTLELRGIGHEHS
jgi:hypothetical protein